MSQLTPEEIRKAEIEFRMRDVVNNLYLLAKLIPDQPTAADFNAKASAPLSELRRRFQMASGKVVRLPR